MKKLNIKQLFPYLLTVVILLFFIIFRFYDTFTSLFILILLGYFGYIYAKKKGYSGILGLILSLFLNFIGLVIIFSLPNKNKKNNSNTLICRINKLNRIKFYFYLLVFTVSVFFLGILIMRSFGSNCEGWDCLIIAPFLIALSIILLTVIIAINLKLIISYEQTNKEDKQNKFLISVYILIIFASFSYGIFNDLFFLNRIIFNRVNNVKLERTMDSFIENKDVAGCLLYINELPYNKHPGHEKIFLNNKCVLEMALLYKDLSICNYYSHFHTFIYDPTYLGHCYTEVLSLMHKKPDMTVYNGYYNQAKFFCNTLQNGRGQCFYIIDNPNFFILNSQEMLSFCQLIEDSEVKLKCINRYSPVSQEEILSFCDRIGLKEPAKTVCIDRFTNLINFRRDYLGK